MEGSQAGLEHHLSLGTSRRPGGREGYCSLEPGARVNGTARRTGERPVPARGIPEATSPFIDASKPYEATGRYQLLCS
jgi:hypothetical protein